MEDNYREKCIREKGEVCEICDTTPEQQEIVVHHLDGDRSNNNLDNLVPVCRSCHGKIHHANDDVEEYHQQLPESAIVEDPYPEAGFPFSEAEDRPVYPRESTLEAFRRFIDGELQDELEQTGIEKPAKREIHDAVLQLAAQRPEEVADIVVDHRSSDR